jgi:leucyl-tRNA synthetase
MAQILAAAAQRSRRGVQAHRRWLSVGAVRDDAQLAVEAKWQARWKQQLEQFSQSPHEREWEDFSGPPVAPSPPARVSAGKHPEPFYSLPMFPYPSGSLHAGHIRVYTITDALARCARMRNKTVLHPIGWDAFGLPAENAAMQHGKNPAEWTRGNTDAMRFQLQKMGVSFDWSREVSTCSPGYFRWTQSLFARMVRKGLAYLGEAEVWWDPVDRTVLANEQIDNDGNAWRSGAKAERRVLKQWFIRTSIVAELLHRPIGEAEEVESDARRRRAEMRERIFREMSAEGQAVSGADVAQRLEREWRETENDGPSGLSGWPREVREMQSAWLGVKTGVLVVDLALDGDASVTGLALPSVSLTPAHLACAVAVVIGPSHPLALRLESKGLVDLASLRAEGASLHGSVDLRSGVALPVHVDLPVDRVAPLSGRRLPVLVLAGAREHSWRLAGREESDGAFGPSELATLVTAPSESDSAEGRLVARSVAALLGDTDAAAEALAHTDPSHVPSCGRITSVASMRDWLVSRQRYWGTPVPVVHCPACGPVALPDERLPVTLPPLDSLAPADATANPSPLARAPEEWRSCKCPQCGGDATRDVDTLDTFIDSSWYFHRYPHPFAESAPCDVGAASSWSPIDVYVGGVEHATTHLLYARFFHWFMQQEGLVETVTPPVKTLLTQGMVLGRVWKDSASQRILTSPDERAVAESDAATGSTRFTSHWEKMSKSKGNGVNAESLLDTTGADVTRLQVLFRAPPPKNIQWEDEHLAGCKRWIARLEAITDELLSSGASDAVSDAKAKSRLYESTRTAVELATDAMTRSFSLNVAVAELMRLSNDIRSIEGASTKDRVLSFSILIRMLAPLAPHTASELWQRLRTGSPFLVQTPPNAAAKAAATAIRRRSEGVVLNDELGMTDVHTQQWPTVDEVASILAGRGPRVCVLER